MAKADNASTRAPRGSKPVVQAFFSALNQVPDAQQVTVARAAQMMIRDELTRRRDKAKDAAAKAKSRQPAAATRRTKVAKAVAPMKKPGRGRPRRTPRMHEYEPAD